MLTGFGSLALRTKNQTNNFIYPGKFVSFELSGDSSSNSSQGYVNGVIQTLSSAVSSETFTLTLTTQDVDFFALAWGFDALPATTASAVFPVTRTATTDGSGVINDADVSGATEVFCYLDSTTNSNTAAPVPDDSVTVGAGTITISSLPNQPIVYQFDKTYTNIQTIGYEAEVTKFGSLSFSGIAYGTKFKGGRTGVYIPDITRQSSPSLSTADVPELSVTYGVNVPAGKSLPVQIYEIPVA